MILTVAMGKGGTAKSTTAAAIANLARMNGKKVLVLDIDPQGNCTAALGGDNGGAGNGHGRGRAQNAEQSFHVQKPP